MRNNPWKNVKICLERKIKERKKEDLERIIKVDGGIYISAGNQPEYSIGFPRQTRDHGHGPFKNRI